MLEEWRGRWEKEKGIKVYQGPAAIIRHWARRAADIHLTALLLVGGWGAPSGRDLHFAFKKLRHKALKKLAPDSTNMN